MSVPGHQATSCAPTAPVHDRSVSTGLDERLTVSLKTLARQLDAHRSSVRRWLAEAGIRPVVLGRGRNSAIRYRWVDVGTWLASRPHVD